VEYNPLDPAVKADPYPYYRHLREEHPVHRVEPLGIYAISRYEDVLFATNHHELFSSVGFSNNSIRGEPTKMMIFTDPPDHTRLRGIVNRSFTPKMVADMEPRIREITGGLVDAIAERGETELIADLAIPLPVTVIAELLGVDPAHNEDFKRWSDWIVADFMGNQLTDEDRVRMEADMDAFQAYFEAAVAQRRARRNGDLISALIRAEEDQQALTENEVLAFIVLLLVAGNETTTNLIGNALVALTDHPDQLEKVVREPSLIPNLVEETLRYDAPVQFLFRRATQDVEMAGTTIPEGSLCIVVFASANRDERKFPDAERFDVTRDAQGQIAFGHGIHFCLGAPLARLEARIALEALLSRFRNFARRTDKVDRITSVFLRGPQRLPLTFEPAAATSR
jgi:cytochrome P450